MARICTRGSRPWTLVSIGPSLLGAPGCVLPSLGVWVQAELSAQPPFSRQCHVATWAEPECLSLQDGLSFCAWPAAAPLPSGGLEVCFAQALALGIGSPDLWVLTPNLSVLAAQGTVFALRQSEEGVVGASSLGCTAAPRAVPRLAGAEPDLN